MNFIIALLDEKLNIQIIGDELFLFVKNRNKGFLKKIVYLADISDTYVKREIFNFLIENKLYEQLAVILSIGKKEQNKNLIKCLMRYEDGADILNAITRPGILNCAINSEIDRKAGVTRLKNIWLSFRELNKPAVFEIVRSSFIQIIDDPSVFERVKKIVLEAYTSLNSR